jgi:hypothetical protein
MLGASRVAASPVHRWRELLVVAGFVCAVFVPFSGKAFHIDEPYFWYVAREFLRHPLHPFEFTYNYWGWPVTFAQLNNHPPLHFILLAGIMKLTGGGETAMRAALLPLDIAGGVGLYLLAARFLRRPLWPTLILIATPAYWINMNHLMAEKTAVILGLWGVYSLVRGVDEDEPRWFWASAALLDLAMLSKYNAVFFLPPALAYGYARGARRRLWIYAGLCLAGPLTYVLYTHVRGLGGLSEPIHDLATAYARPWARWHHKLRSILSFIGGCGVVTAIWPFLVVRPRLRSLAAALLMVGALFWPGLDLAPVRGLDRATGILLSCGALWGIGNMAAVHIRQRGGPLWAAWTASGLLGTWLYCSVSARVILLLLPPFVLAAAEALEARVDGPRLSLWYRISLTGVCLVSLTLAGVDYRYAGVQREYARRVVRERAGSGRIWCASVLGLRHYLDEAGASDIDRSQGGWRQVRPGDVVVSSLITEALAPETRLMANVSRLRVDCAIPVRLICVQGGEGGFYSNAWGFLPFSLSREPLEEFTLVERL